MTPADLDRMVKHLYQDTLSEKERRMKDLDKKHNIDERRHTTLTPDDMEQSVSRLYYTRIKTIEEQRHKLRERWLAPLPKMAKGKDKVEAGLQNLYYKERARSVERTKKLNEMYVEHTGPKVPKRTPEECKAIVARLTK
jgi:hypothetical protein